MIDLRKRPKSTSGIEHPKAGEFFTAIDSEHATDIGSNAFASHAVIASAGTAANGLIVGTSWSASTVSAANKAFIKNFKKTYKRTPDQFAATAYAYTYVLAAAAKKARSATQDAITTQLTAMTGGRTVSTLLGPFAFDAARNGVSPVTVQQVVKGKFKPFKAN